MNVRLGKPISVCLTVMLVGAIAACGPAPPSQAPDSDSAQQPASDSGSDGLVPDLVKVTSITEFFNLSAPADWSTAETIPGGAFVMANSQAAMDRFRAGDGVEAGDFVLNIGFLPDTLLESNEIRSLDIQVGAEPDVLLASMLPMFNSASEASLGSPELVATDSGRSAARLDVGDTNGEGMILLLEVGEGVHAIVSTVAAPGELAQYENLTFTISDTIEFVGPEGELYGTLLGS